MQLFLPTLVFVGAVISIGAAYRCGHRPNVDNNGYDHEEPRIVGGKSVVPHSWPWQVLLQWDNGTHQTSCGGTIVADRWILTAAHCVYQRDIYGMKAYVGVQNLDDLGTPLTIQKKFVYPDYSPKHGAHDIALLKVTHPIQYNNHVQPVCLTSVDDDDLLPPNKAWITGWGVTEKGDMSNELMELQVPLVDFDECVDVFETKPIEENYKPVHHKLQVCAGRRNQSTCNGDSGGPLVMKGEGGSWFQHGITSFGPDKCDDVHPAVYTRISYYCPVWMAYVTRGAIPCH